MKSDAKNKSPLEIMPPEEKLLRKPTFWEKNTWLKPTVISLIIVITIILGLSYISPSKNQMQGPNSTNPQFASPAQWKTYTSDIGQYSIKYPSDYILDDTNSFDTIQIKSTILPSINTSFSISLQYKTIAGGQTMAQLISQNPICPSNPNAIGSKASGNIGTENTEKSAEFFIDTLCDSDILTVAYTINNNMLYIITLRSKDRFSDIKPYVDKIISTIKFSDRMNQIPEASTSSQMPVCTQDAKQCPDGSWVGRTGKNCEFVCPAMGTTNIPQTDISPNQSYPQDSSSQQGFQGE